MKEFKDYYLYLGATVKVKRKNDSDFHIGRICEVTKKSNHGDWIQVWFDEVVTVTNQVWETSSSNCHWFFIDEDFIQLILRPLSDMTEEEGVEYAQFYCKKKIPSKRTVKINSNHESGSVQVLISSGESNLSVFPGGPHGDIAEAFRYLLSKGFDLFNLIPEKLAIDKTSLQTQQ